jgi:antitoxin component of MazEF toxin-antitoxin module
VQFSATIQLDGKTATGVEVPAEVVSALGGGNRPRVRVTLNGYSYQTTVARMGGKSKFPVSAAVREQAGVGAGDRVEVEIELDDAPREVVIPPALAEALDEHPDAKEAFGKLSYTNQKRHVLAVEGAKTEETRQRRLQKIVSELRGLA